MKDELQKLINEGKLEEAFNVFKESFTKEKGTDIGQISALLLEAYIDATNTINSEEGQKLDQIKNVLKEIQTADESSARLDAIEKIKSISQGS